MALKTGFLQQTWRKTIVRFMAESGIFWGQQGYPNLSALKGSLYGR
jgi:hypothetical protein